MHRPTPLTEREALVAYATMLNRADPSVLAPLLADDVRLTSQQVLEDLVGKPAFLDYMTGKFDTMREAGLLPRDGRHSGVPLGLWPGRDGDAP